MVANEGSLATLTVYVSGTPTPDVYWRKGRRDVDTRRGKFRIIDGATLQVIFSETFSGVNASRRD